MTTQEFSDQFDILYNNIASNATPGVDEYEKSVFLTKAQEEIVIRVYNGTYEGDSFEGIEEVRRYISELIREISLTSQQTGYIGASPKSVFYQIPDDVWFRTLEEVKYASGQNCVDQGEPYVQPITQDEYHTIKRNPFKRQNERRVLRLDLRNNISELISNYPIESYYLRYLVRPTPIVLADLTDYNTSINGVTTITECELNPIIHNTILSIAVELAKQSWNLGGDMSN